MRNATTRRAKSGSNSRPSRSPGWLKTARVKPAPLAMIPFLGPLAVGGDLQPDRVLDAYRRGIFPWGTVDGQPLWYSPDPRMVLFPEEFRLTSSLKKTLRGGKFAVRFDTDFAGVMAACATTPRAGQDGTWITPEMTQAYVRLHELGWAHSVESYEGDTLVGGLYGLAIGRMFYGESMFSRRTDASKVAFAHLVRYL